LFSKIFLVSRKKISWSPGKARFGGSIFGQFRQDRFLRMQPVLGVIENVSVCLTNLGRRFSDRGAPKGNAAF
jgi:hypothetical protein